MQLRGRALDLHVLGSASNPQDHLFKKLSLVLGARWSLTLFQLDLS